MKFPGTAASPMVLGGSMKIENLVRRPPRLVQIEHGPGNHTLLEQDYGL